MSAKSTIGYGLSGLDYWRLSDELSVVDIAFLTLNMDPGCFELVDLTDPEKSKIVRIGGFEDWETRALHNGDIDEVIVQPNQFRAVFKALRNAIIGNKVRANVVTRAREPSYVFEGEVEPYDTGENAGEESLNYGFIVSRGTPTLFSNSVNIQNTSATSSEGQVIYLLKEPDWNVTSIEVDCVKEWYSSRGFFPAFFFPKGNAEGFRDSNNSRYSAKLATAISAWEAVKKPNKNKSPKQSLTDWIVSNGVQFGLGNDDGVVSPTVAEEIAKVANWQTSGGATRTIQLDDDNQKENLGPIGNFKEVEDLDAIPF
jgi:hypothetical protein